MAKNRMVSTSFWSDHYIADLDPTEKLLFLYLLTNERSTLAGVYELPLKIMAVESGIETEMVRKILGRFEEEGKIMFKDGWVVIKKFLKYHEHGSPTVRKGIEDAIYAAPEWARDFIGKGIDTLSPSSLSSTSSIEAGLPPAQEIKEVPINLEERPKRESKAKYPNARTSHSWFPNPEPVWLVSSTDLKCLELLHRRGEDDVKKAIKYCTRHMADEGFPIQYLTPYLLETNWLRIANYAKRNS